jgi:glycosyltransferase involved in cell wall biosynthesis
MTRLALVSKAWRAGAGWFCQELVTSIAEAGAKVVFIAPLAMPESREPCHSNIERVVIPREITVNAPRAKRALASLMRVMCGSYQVLRCMLDTDTFLFSLPDPLIFTIPVFALLRLSGARVIFIVHDVTPHAWRLGPKLRAVERGAHAISYRLASKIVTLTSAARDELVGRFGMSPQKISVIPHGAYDLGKRAPLKRNCHLLLFGTLRKNKRVLQVIEAVKCVRMRYPELRLVIAGEPHSLEAEYWEACKTRIAGDPDGFEVHDHFISDEDLSGLVERTDAFVLAYENFTSQSGVGILAGLNARPVIGTNVGGLGELFAQGMVGEIIDTPVTAEGIASAIERFLATPADIWSDRAVSASEKLARHLSWTRIGREYVLLAEKR